MTPEAHRARKVTRALRWISLALWLAETAGLFAFFWFGSFKLMVLVIAYELVGLLRRSVENYAKFGPWRPPQ